MDGPVDGRKEKRCRAETDTRDKWTDESQKTPLHVKIEVCLCVTRRERERLMDGWVYTAGDIQEGVGGGISMIRGGTWSDVMDLTGPMSPEEREIQIDG